MKKIKKLVKLTLLIMICMLAVPSHVTTLNAKAAATSVKTVKKQGKWQKKNQKMYYVVSGKRQKGLVKIGKKTYFFDADGVQRTGWRKFHGEYHYFNIANGADGYMVKSKKVNGITLRKDGTAKIVKGKNDYKIKALHRATKMVDKITKPTMTKKEKLRKCYDYCVKNIKYSGSPTFKKGNQWDAKYAIDVMKKSKGNCYGYGAAFAYMANAIGYKDCYAVSSGGHGWAEVNNRVYDISWELVDKKHDYFGLSYDLSGKGGRPNYRKHKYYVKEI